MVEKVEASGVLIRHAAPRVVLYGLVVASPYVVGAFAGGEEADNGLVFAAGLNAALVAYVIIAMQFVLTAHYRWVERPLGYAKVIVFHKTMGATAGLLLLSHPTGMAIGAAGLDLFTGGPFFVWVGKVTLLLLLAHVTIALFRKSLGLDYQKWLAIHNPTAALILCFGFYHSWNTEADLAPVAVRVLWALIFAVAVVSYFHGRIVVGLRRRRAARPVAA